MIEATDRLPVSTQWATAAVLWVLAAAAFAVIGGGPVTNDELKYLELSIAPERQAFVLNRYGHIWLQALFVHLAPDPITGAQWMWATVIGGSIAFVFLGAGLLAQTSSLLPGGAAVVLYLTQITIFRYIGTPYADFTVATLVALGAAVYACPGLDGRVRAALLGAILVFALRSKETGIILLALLPVVAPSDRQRLHPLAAIGWWLAGGTALQGVLMAVDAVLLGDFWFSLRPSSIAELLGFNVGEWEHTPGNWFAWIAMSEVSVPFACFLLALPLLRADGSPWRRMVAWMPFALMIFLGLAGINGNWGVIPRYFAPALPVLCIVAAVWLHDQGLGRLPIRELVPRPALALLALGAAGTAWAGWSLRALPGGKPLLGTWTPYMLAQNVGYPLVLVALASILLFVSAPRWRRFLALAVIGLGVSPMLVALPNTLGFTARTYGLRAFPLDAFAPHLRLTRDSRIQVSPTLWERYGMFESAERLTRVWSGVMVPFENFAISADRPLPGAADYVFASVADLERWRENGGTVPGAVHIKGKAVLVCPSGC